MVTLFISSTLTTGAGRQADKQEASTSQMMSAELQTPADTPTLTFPTPSLRLQQRTPVLTGPAVLQPMSPAVSHAAAASGPTASSTAPGNAPLTGAFPISPLPLTVPSANAPEPAAMPNSPVHGVWNRKTQAASHDQPAAAVFSGSADRGTTTNLADVAAELLPETPHLPGRLVGQQAGYMGPMQEHVFDHRSLLTPAEPQSAALLAVRMAVTTLTIPEHCLRTFIAPHSQQMALCCVSDHSLHCASPCTLSQCLPLHREGCTHSLYKSNLCIR